ncbi:Alkyl hydroperoxide reductase AhpD [Polystyrenella longa]|uniref:Alkyl hydroperoxide reductase AhpD n=1 Tax=Polystyrenella longa TaxID=2528007 RepID=A0A518CIU3_9PLAN|nr:carboxymuconolactone decarboxylase family protein [Polystyrenella longa]QDU79155.1 Alkyl hydroperoxide reductase AhpD [Polystyrenella longa]
MTTIIPLPESEAQDKIAQTYDRIKDMLELDAVPEPFLVYARVPPFLQDFFMNFKKFVIKEGKLDPLMKAYLGLSVSSLYRCKPWIDFFDQRALKLGATEQQLQEVLAVAATNSMYNTFFKFRDISGSDLFEGLPVGLRAHTFTNTSLDETTIELINIALSDLNACKPCVTGHLAKARSLQVKDEAILEAIQCTATMLAGVQFLNSVTP